jgi:hypothetical protein
MKDKNKIVLFLYDSTSLNRNHQISKLKNNLEILFKGGVILINIHSNGNRTSYGIKHFVLDTIEDIKELDKNKLTPGSTIFIIASSKYYILNGKKQWIEINPYCMGHSSGGSGNDNSGTENDGIYDGGSIDGSDPV